jgi:outer membrane immunogenic protein
MQMKSFLTILAAAFAIAAPRAASAADMSGPFKAPMPAYAAPAFVGWTGFYAGLNAGYAFGKSDWDSPAISTDPDGAVVGGTLGYNMQSGAWVFGLEGDFDWADISGSVSTCTLGTCESKADWFATARGRVGYAVGSALIFATGGGAFADVKVSNSVWTSTSKTMTGWTLGGGIEYAFMGRWSAKVEYLYSDLGTFDCGATCAFATPGEINVTTSTVRGGINYRF